MKRDDLRRRRAGIADIQSEFPRFGRVDASGVTLLDFKSLSCDPCRYQKPIIERSAKRFEGAASLMEIDIGEYRLLVAGFGITGIPTLIIFKDGVELKRFVGLQSAEVLSTAIESVLKGKSGCRKVREKAWQILRRQD